VSPVVGSGGHTTYTRQPATLIEMASKFEKFFREADTDGSGYLTVDELIALLCQKGYKASDEKIRVSKMRTGHFADKPVR